MPNLLGRKFSRKCREVYESGALSCQWWTEVLKWEEVDDPVAGSDEVLIRLEAVGLNYIDTYHREDYAPSPFPAFWGWRVPGRLWQQAGNGQRCRR